MYCKVFSSNHQNVFGGIWPLVQKINIIWQQYLTIESEDQYDSAALFSSRHQKIGNGFSSLNNLKRVLSEDHQFPNYIEHYEQTCKRLGGVITLLTMNLSLSKNCAATAVKPHSAGGAYHPERQSEQDTD
uniref:Uncharacterized protein n=1 Tax=Glossina pallidipes TaxID=7398 RepID=A0A1A9ZRP1_GLOPL